MSQVESAVDDDEPHAGTCPYCDRPFARRRLLALHKGLDHYHRLDPDERREYEDAYEEESADIRLFRLKVIGALVVLYFGFLFIYLLLT